METPYYDFDSPENSSRREVQTEEDQIVASLYQDIDMDIDDRFSAPLGSKQVLLSTKSSNTKNFHFSIPIHTQKFNEQKPFSTQYFSSFKPGVEPATTGLSSSTKCGMDSPSFCKGDSDAFSPTFPIPTSEDVPRDTQQPIKQGLLSDSEIKSPTTQESAQGPLSAKLKALGAIQEVRRGYNSLNPNKGSPALNTPEYGISKPTLNLYAQSGQRSDRVSSTRSAGFEMKGSTSKKVPSYFFEESTPKGLNNELQRPESTPDLEKNLAASAVQTSRTAGIEVSFLEPADPLSLGNFDEKSRLRSKPVSSQVSSRRTLRESGPKAASNSAIATGSSKPNSNQKVTNPVKKEDKMSEKSDNRSTLYKKILAQGKKPKEIEVHHNLITEYKPKVEQKQPKSPVAGPTRNVNRSQTPKSMTGTDSSTKQMNMTATEHPLKAWQVKNGNPSPKRGAITTIATEPSFSKDAPNIVGSSSPKRGAIGKPSWFMEANYNSGNSRSSPKSLKESPKLKSSNSQKSLNSIALTKVPSTESPMKSPKRQENSRMENNALVNKSAEVKRGIAQTTLNLRDLALEKGIKTTSNAEKQSRTPKTIQQRLQQHLDEEIKPLPVAGKQLEVIEANLREIQGQNLLHPNSPKHIRYPSFGSGIVAENQRRPSSRRTISQDSQCVQALQSFVQSIDKDKSPKETVVSSSVNKVQSPLKKIVEGRGTQSSPASKPSTLKNLVQSPEKDKNDKEPVASKSLNKVQVSSLKKIEENREIQPSPVYKQSKEVKPSHASLMHSLNLRRNLTAGSQEDSTPQSSRSHRAVVDTSADAYCVDPMPMSVHSGSTFSSGFSRGVDIYQRNAQWLSTKQNKIQQINFNKKKEEMRECTFKPYRHLKDNVESEYSQKSFNNYGVGKLISEANGNLERRSLSREKRNINSYNGFHSLKKEVMSPKTGVAKSPKSYFSQNRESYENKILHTNPH